MPTLVKKIESVETTTVDTTLKVRMKGNRWEGYICLPELPTFLDQLEMYGSSDEEEHNNTDQDQDQDQDQDDDDGKYTKLEGCHHVEMVDKENVKELVGKPPPRHSAREKEKQKPDKEKKKPDPMLDVTNITTTQHQDMKEGKPGKSSQKKKTTSLESTSVMQQTKPTKSKRGDATAYLERKKEETKSFDWQRSCTYTERNVFLIRSLWGPGSLRHQACWKLGVPERMGRCGYMTEGLDMRAGSSSQQRDEDDRQPSSPVIPPDMGPGTAGDVCPELRVLYVLPSCV
jgi:hypothetical protein